jgi:restriction system protein
MRSSGVTTAWNQISLSIVFKGWIGELKTIIAKKVFLRSSDYIDLNNVTIHTGVGTTQIDHIIISRYGVFVVETKNMNGWIFGCADNPQWTKTNRGHKLTFQNPLHQNHAHIKALSKLIGVHPSMMHSVVMFRGDCSLRTPMPPNVLTSGYASYIKSKTKVFFDEPEVRRIVSAIRKVMLPKTRATRLAHAAHLRQRFESTTSCAKCGSPLVLRTARSGKHAGNQFFGCSRYPSCRYVRKVDRLVST